MGKRRPKADPHMPWEQLQLRLTSEEQYAYEHIRPVILFGQPVLSRAHETQVAESTLRRQIIAFERTGMRSLFPVEAPQSFRELPADLRDLILTLHADHPPMRPNEIATICFMRTGHHPSPHTVKRLLATAPPRQQHQRRFPLYHQIPDPFERRRAIVRLHLEGWNRKSIAGYLGINRSTVYDTIRRWIAEGLIRSGFGGQVGCHGATAPGTPPDSDSPNWSGAGDDYKTLQYTRTDPTARRRGWHSADAASTRF